MKYKFGVDIILLNLLIVQSYASVSSGPYVGLEIGGTNQTINYNSAAFNLNISGNAINNSAWGILGRLNIGYNLNKYSGFELGYNYNALPEYNYPNNMGVFNGKVSTLDASYMLYIPTIVQKLSVFGRVGVGYDWINGNTSSINISSPSGANFADVLGAGIKYNLTPKTSFRLEWVANGLLFPINLNNGSANIANFSEQTFMLGFNYHF